MPSVFTQQNAPDEEKSSGAYISSKLSGDALNQELPRKLRDKLFRTTLDLMKAAYSLASINVPASTTAASSTLDHEVVFANVNFRERIFG